MTKVKKKHDAEELEKAKKRVRELLRKEFFEEAKLTMEERKEFNRLTKYWERHRPRNAEMIVARRAKRQESKESFSADLREWIACFGNERLELFCGQRQTVEGG